MSIDLTFKNLSPSQVANLTDYYTEVVEVDKAADALVEKVSTEPEAVVAPVAAPEAVVAPVAAPEAVVAPVTAPTWPQDNGAGVMVDSRGLPHDLRIHGKSKLCKVKDGQWKLARSVDPVLVTQIEAELAALMVPVQAPEAVVAPVAAPEAVVAPVAAPEAVVAPVAAPEAVVVADFPTLMLKLAPMIDSAIITTEVADSYAQQLGVQSVQLMAARPDLIPQLWANINAAIAAIPANTAR